MHMAGGCMWRTVERPPTGSVVELALGGARVGKGRECMSGNGSD